MRFIALFCFAVPSLLMAADFNKPHTHKGIIKAYIGEPPRIKLDQTQLKKINAGETAYTQTAQENGGSAVAVFKVNQPPKAVRKILMDIESYPKWIDSLKKVRTYKREGNTIWTEFTIEVKALFITSTYTYYIEHDYASLEDKGWGTWKLDYSHLSDLDESIGFWRVDPVEGHPSQSLVYYSVNLRVGGFANLFKSYIEDKGLKEATQWVKKAADALPAPVAEAAPVAPAAPAKKAK